MAESSVKVKFEAQVKQLRETWKEIDKRQKKETVLYKDRLKLEQKHHKQSLKEFKEFSSLKEGTSKKEVRALKVKHALADKERRTEIKHFRLQEQTERVSINEKKREYAKLKRETAGGPPAGMWGRPGQGKRGALSRGAAFAGGGIVGLIAGAALQGYQRYIGMQQTFGEAIGLGVGAPQQGGGTQFGFNRQQVAGMVPGMARATGAGNVTPLMQARRATGMQQGQLLETFGAIAAGGAGFEKGQRGKKEFERIMTGSVASGLKKGRMHEFASGVTQMLRQQQTISAGRVGTGDISRLAAMFGARGGTGFQGVRGFGVLQKIQQGVQAPGGGTEGAALTRQLLGYGRPGQRMSFYDVEKAREQGITGKGGFERFQNMMDNLGKQFPDQREQAMVMKQLWGTSLSQNETLMKIADSNLSQEEKEEAFKKTQKESKTIQEQAKDAMEGSHTELVRMAGRFNRSVRIGEQSRDAIQAIEDLQLETAEFFFRKLPEVIKEAQYLWEELRHLKEGIFARLEELPFIGGAFKKENRAEILEGEMDRIRREGIRKRGGVMAATDISAEQKQRIAGLSERKQTLLERQRRQLGKGKTVVFDPGQFAPDADKAPAGLAANEAQKAAGRVNKKPTDGKPQRVRLDGDQAADLKGIKDNTGKKPEPTPPPTPPAGTDPNVQPPASPTSTR